MPKVADSTRSSHAGVAAGFTQITVKTSSRMHLPDVHLPDMHLAERLDKQGHALAAELGHTLACTREPGHTLASQGRRLSFETSKLHGVAMESVTFVGDGVSKAKVVAREASATVIQGAEQTAAAAAAAGVAAAHEIQTAATTAEQALEQTAVAAADASVAAVEIGVEMVISEAKIFNEGRDLNPIEVYAPGEAPLGLHAIERGVACTIARTATLGEGALKAVHAGGGGRSRGPPPREGRPTRRPPSRD